MKKPRKMDESIYCTEDENLLRWAKVQAARRQAGGQGGSGCGKRGPLTPKKSRNSQAPPLES